VEQSPGVPATATGDTAAIWLDQSGQGNDLTVPAAIPSVFSPVAPKYLTGAVNGQPVVRFTLGNQSLQAPSSLVSGTGDYSVFAVFAAGPGLTNERVIGGTYGSGAGSSGMKINVYLDKARSYNAGYVVGATTVDDGAFYLLQVERVSGVTTIRINNVVDGSGAQPTSIAAALNWTIGSNANLNSGATSTADLKLAEELVYTDSLDEADRRDVAAYLANKYDIAAADIPEPAAGMILALALTPLLARRRRA
jgi:hypothetical protein